MDLNIFYYISPTLSLLLSRTVFARHPQLVEYGHEKQGSPYSRMHRNNYPAQ